MTHEWTRSGFGVLAFMVTSAVIAMVLSPYVQDSKEAIANVVLGNVLGWPATVLAWHFGSTKSSAEKNAVIAAMADGPAASGKAGDPVHVTEDAG